MTEPRRTRGARRGVLTADIRAQLEETLAGVVVEFPEGQAAHWCGRAMRASTRQSFLGNGEVGLRQALAHQLPGDLRGEVASALEQVKALREGVSGTRDAPAARRARALQGLREEGARLGRAPAVPDFSGRPEALRSIRRSFGGLRQATLLAGMVPPRRFGRPAPGHRCWRSWNASRASAAGT
jgi:hypothetical protein